MQSRWLTTYTNRISRARTRTATAMNSNHRPELNNLREQTVVATRHPQWVYDLIGCALLTACLAWEGGPSFSGQNSEKVPLNVDRFNPVRTVHNIGSISGTIFGWGG
ncbi:hypothetical protein NL676_002390 [Syzygium grande]|nr:hypothetical protein NL676_002390 [Syzygium grande]